MDVESIVGFEYDEGKIHKNEEVFFNEPLLVVEDFKYSLHECRCVALGKNDFDDLVTVIFTLRNKHIRVISARAMSEKERKIYERA